MTSPCYCIIGAGAAGLAALHVLTGQGIDTDCFERTDRVGGHWHTDYDSLHLITSRDVSGFAGFPMPIHYPVYPSREQMCEYLQSFAAQHGLNERITFDSKVTSVAPKGRAGLDGWLVETADGKVRGYDAVLIANGHLTEPLIPSYEGDFTGKQIHSAHFRNIGDINGERVLVVGAGNSGCDLAVDAANHRLDAHISIRHGQMFQPKAIFGKPRAELSWLTRLPSSAQERLTRALVEIVLGPTSAYRGLPEPVTRNLSKQRPVVNNLLLYWIQHGRITVQPGIRRLAGRTVHFTDGTWRAFDTIIWATGFHASLPFLDDSLLTRQDGVPLRVAGLTVPVGLEQLYLIGLAAPRGPQLPVYSAQAKLVVRCLGLQQREDVALSAFFSGRQTPDSRIDIVRKEWQRQMDHTHRLLTRLQRQTARIAGFLRTPTHDKSLAQI